MNLIPFIKTPALVTLVLTMHGCAAIPPEAVTLNQAVGESIDSLHQSNLRLTNQYFDQKITRIDELEKEALNHFFNQIITGTQSPEASPLGAKELNSIKDATQRIHKRSEQFKSSINAIRVLILKHSQTDYDTLTKANTAITGLLQSGVNLDQAQSDGLFKLKTISHNTIDLTQLDPIIENYIHKFDSTTSSSLSLIKTINGLVSPNKGTK